YQVVRNRVSRNRIDQRRRLNGRWQPYNPRQTLAPAGRLVQSLSSSKLSVTMAMMMRRRASSGTYAGFILVTIPSSTFCHAQETEIFQKKFWPSERILDYPCTFSESRR